MKYDSESECEVDVLVDGQACLRQNPMGKTEARKLVQLGLSYMLSKSPRNTWRYPHGRPWPDCPTIQSQPSSCNDMVKARTVNLVLVSHEWRCILHWVFLVRGD